jgi:hypothetical protein
MGDDNLQDLIANYEAMAPIQDGEADHLNSEGERGGWHDDLTQAIDELRHKAGTNRMLAHEVRDGMAV